MTVTWPVTERTTETMSVTVRTSVDRLTRRTAGTHCLSTRRRESKLLTAGFGRCRRSAELRGLGRPAAENQGVRAAINSRVVRF